MRGDPRQREILVPPFGVAVVRLDIERALEQEGVVETVELLLDRIGRALRIERLVELRVESEVT